MNTFPFVELLSDESELPVSILVWHIRAVRPLHDPLVDKRDVTRIEFANGDTFDSSESTGVVLMKIRDVIQTARDWFAAAVRPPR